MSHLDHKHLILNANIAKPPTDTEQIKQWLKDLVDITGIKLVLGPHAHYYAVKDNKGLAVICIIETLYALIHVWDKEKIPYLRFDVYSCSCFDVDKIIEHLKIFEPISCEWKLIDRNDTTHGQI